jgi:EpsD family peptidyl-prolyl cis-trans isomerase
MHCGFSTFARTTLFVFCGLVLLGCGRGSDNQANKTKGQVVARVGEEVITATELENELRLANVPPDKYKDPETLKRIFNDLAARKYLYRQAVAAKLDREPGVLLDMLRAREGVLANALVSRNVGSKAAALTQTEIDRYIAANPSKFANRQLLTVEQIAFQAGANLQAIVDSTKEKKSLDEIDQQLTAMNVPHGRSVSSINSADMPEAFMSQMREKKPDEVFFFRTGTNAMFLVVRREEARPLVGEAAHNLARQAVRADLMKAELGMASVAANLETKYEGEYANLSGQKPVDPNVPQR